MRTAGSPVHFLVVRHFFAVVVAVVCSTFSFFDSLQSQSHTPFGPLRSLCCSGLTPLKTHKEKRKRHPARAGETLRTPRCHSSVALRCDRLHVEAGFLELVDSGTSPDQSHDLSYANRSTILKGFAPASQPRVNNILRLYTCGSLSLFRDLSVCFYITSPKISHISHHRRGFQHGEREVATSARSLYRCPSSRLLED